MKVIIIILALALAVIGAPITEEVTTKGTIKEGRFTRKATIWIQILRTCPREQERTSESLNVRNHLTLNT